MSWMQNEENYDRQLNNYRDDERTKPLPLRAESGKPDEVLRDWFTLTYRDKNEGRRRQIFATRAKVYTDYENLPYFTFQRAMTGAGSRWARLPEILKRLEPHSPINLEAALHQAAKYIELGR